MEYPYFSSAPQQAYPYYGQQPPQDPSQEQFGSLVPGPDQQQQQFGPSFQQFEQYQFSHPPLQGQINSIPSAHYPRQSVEAVTSGPSIPTALGREIKQDSIDSNAFPQSIPNENGEDGQQDRDPRSSSEEKDSNMTPAQSRRKAQNRAAQRAFRERKERRVRDLEQELTEYKQNFSNLLEDNEVLKRQMAKVATENEILRATSKVAHCHSPAHEPEPTTTGPMIYSPKDYSSTASTVSGGSGPSLEREKHAKPIHPIRVCEITGERLLDASATWDLIVSHLSDSGAKLDVQDIYDRLKGRAQCDGTGPVIGESQVIKAIQDSIAAGNDELI
ncbi:TPA_exp: putative BZIP transcription factor (Fcr3) [Trichophyton benhamiae CBS 112371]|uniref:BZIP transcription factor (Fcr3), putative n=1 Tax=Arthroderma benhamiae (strain ATCC MYA-4681 / CBS 112371) TaxID=663331 RepID=D4B4R1_ARTBC|nr:bZIP transcription factor (Fcr3), putative [Trichophyton benhamiae CBS 112371]EFE30109.1 bZIP transcription factor (Fcr3), putative [Trichophyton benhamiae CBS 112371]DAA73344.1 TPA_exp: putative BZIP transcription factor (Fcr3) [Trichophyton benhamiae CBS 112371]